MKKVVLVMVLPLIILCGCQEFMSGGSSNKLVGTWQSDDEDPWKFIFAKGGSIPLIFRDDGLIMDTQAGWATIGKPDGPIFANHVFGPCNWSYVSKSNILRVTITIEDFYVRAETAELNCKVIDTFEGPLSDDGKTWTAVWTTTTKWGENFPDQVVTDRKIVLNKIQ